MPAPVLRMATQIDGIVKTEKLSVFFLLCGCSFVSTLYASCKTGIWLGRTT